MEVNDRHTWAKGSIGVINHIEGGNGAIVDIISPGEEMLSSVQRLGMDGWGFYLSNLRFIAKAEGLDE